MALPHGNRKAMPRPSSLNCEIDALPTALSYAAIETPPETERAAFGPYSIREPSPFLEGEIPPISRARERGIFIASRPFG